MVVLGIVLLVIGLLMLNWVGRQYAKSVYERPMILHNVVATLFIQLFTWGSLIAGAIITFMNLPWLLAVVGGGYVLLLLFSKKTNNIQAKADKFIALIVQNRIKLGVHADFVNVVQLTVNQYCDFYNWTAFNKKHVFERVIAKESESLRLGDWVGIGTSVLNQEYHNQMEVKHNGSIDYLMKEQTFNDLKVIDLAVKKAAQETMKKYKV